MSARAANRFPVLMRLRRLTALRFSRIARTRDRSTHVECDAGYVGCKRELGDGHLHGLLQQLRAGEAQVDGVTCLRHLIDQPDL